MLAANTIIFAGFSTLFAARRLATGLSWLLERTDLPARNLFRAMILMPMATPPLLLAIGWALVLAPRIGIVAVAIAPLFGSIERWFDIYSMPGAVFVQMLAYVPTSVLMLSPAIRALDPALEEAALAAGADRWQVMWRIVLPLLWPAILSVMTILLIVGMLAFDVPAVIGIPGHVDLMSIEIFRLMTPPSGFPEYGEAAAMKSRSCSCCWSPDWYCTGGPFANRLVTPPSAAKAINPRRSGSAGWRRAATSVVALYFFLAVVLPFLALLWVSLIPYFAGFGFAMLQRVSVKSYADLLASPQLRTAGINAVVVAVTTAGTLFVLALATAWIVLRSKLRRAWVLDVFFP